MANFIKIYDRFYINKRAIKDICISDKFISIQLDYIAFSFESSHLYITYDNEVDNCDINVSKNDFEILRDKLINLIDGEYKR